MRAILVTIMLATLGQLSFGQSTMRSWELIHSIKVKVQRCKIDQLNNVYALKKGELFKYDSQGKEINRYSNKLIGEDIQIDVTNPMKVLLYSADQMKLVTLDSRLGEMNETINFFERGYEQISLVATSYDNALWIYDPINFQLIRLSDKLKEQSKSLNIAQHLRLDLYPTDLVEVNSKVYLTDPNHGVFEFDVFGNYLRKIPIKGIKHLSVSDARLFYKKDDAIVALNLKTSEAEVLKIKDAESDNFSVNRNRVVVTVEDEVNIFQAKG